jgi:hypothetical protein
MQQQQQSKRDDDDDDCVEINDTLWHRILSLYLTTYRGPTADQDLKVELRDYKVLKKNGMVAVGKYVRYMSRGVIDCELRRGGYVVKCSSKSVQLQDARRQRTWRVSRAENYIFVRETGLEETKTQYSHHHRKSMLRMLAEEAIRKDDDHILAAATRFQMVDDP